MSEKQPKLKFEEEKERTAMRSPPKKSKVEQSVPKKQKLKQDADKAAEKSQHLRFGKAEITPDEASRMRLSLQPTRTGNTFIITLSTTPLRWTAPGNSGIFYCPGWLCNG